jgi:putative methionine-R-sulfoxide reductase with GAF domain
MACHDSAAISLADVQNKGEFYELLLQKASAAFNKERNHIANCANLSAIIYHGLIEVYGNMSVNWCGLYFVEAVNTLCLGPFQGKPAVTRISFDSGVCGAAARSGETQLVPDVHEFPGHIACDNASQSEIVIPVMDKTGVLVGVLDLDSPTLHGFDAEDKVGLEALASALGQGSDWSGTTEIHF